MAGAARFEKHYSVTHGWSILCGMAWWGSGILGDVTKISKARRIESGLD